METNNFKIILGILSAIERQMDSAVVDKARIGAEAFDASPERWRKLMKMLQDEGLISGFKTSRESGEWKAYTKDIAITLKGLEYLRDLTERE